MRQFPLWNKPITSSLDTLKWQIKCLRHSLIMWVQLSEDINGFPLYLLLPSGCFDFLKLWRLKWWYLRIISSEVKVRTPGKVLRHSVRVSVSLPNWCFSELYRLVEHVQETSKHRGEKWSGNRCTWVQQSKCHYRAKLNWWETGKSATSWKSHNLLAYARNLCWGTSCYKYEVGRSPNWWCASACRDSVSWWELLTSLQSIGKNWCF